MSKKEEVNNTTETLAIEFVKNTVRTIEAQLKVEIERNGFKLEDLKAGKIKLVRNVAKAENDGRFVCESFSIGSRLIMAVKWNPGGFNIERNNDEAAKAISVSPGFGIKKGTTPALVQSATQREIEIEAGAQKYLKDFYKKGGLSKV
jgi:hypothetical protein